MFEPKLAKKLCAMGLLVALYGCNVAYANGNTNATRVAPPIKERSEPLNVDKSSKPLDSAADKTTLSTNEKKGPSLKSLTKAGKSCSCSCAPPTGRTAAAAGPWWDCMKGCLRSWGVSVIQLVMCAGACAGGMVPVCALCLGLDVTIVMLCAIGCDVYAGGTENPENPRAPILTRKMPGKNRLIAERSSLAFAAHR